jgi:hypothetical protein
MSLIDTAVQKDFGMFPFFLSEQREIMAEKYGNDVLREIEEIRHNMWEYAIKHGKNQSVQDFGKRCRAAAKEQYPLLEEKTIDVLANSLEYAYWK